MFTDPKHINVNDPGQIENNPVFTYLQAFDPDQESLRKMEEHYQKGGLGDVKVKKHLFAVLQEFLSPIRKRREEFAKDPAEVMNIIRKGTEKAQDVANLTLANVKKAMGINYFS